jgi:hypothetical protein
MIGTLILTQGKVAIVDAADMPLVAGRKWSALRAKNGRWYAKAKCRDRYLYLHRVIAGAPEGFDVDHRDHDGLNNRRENLRVATRAQNNANQRKTRGRSRFKGVSPWEPDPRKWVAQITEAGKRRSLGLFPSEEAAARAYDEAAFAFYGDFAALNFPMGDR